MLISTTLLHVGLQGAPEAAGLQHVLAEDVGGHEVVAGLHEGAGFVEGGLV